jgi:tetratricopeptide (TPR) repeat protein
MGLSGFKLQLVENLATAGEAAGYSDADIVEAIKKALADREVPGAPVTARSPEEAWGEFLEAPAAVAGRTDMDDAQLAQALLRRYEATRDLSDLGEALETAMRAVAVAPPDSPLAPQLRLLLARALIERYGVSGAFEELDRAAESTRDALDLIPGDSGPLYEFALRTLAEIMQLRYEVTGVIANQDEAVAALRLLEETRRARVGSTGIGD